MESIRFGCSTDTQFFFRITGLENTDHIMLKCPYTERILRKLLLLLAPGLKIIFNPWNQLLSYIADQIRPRSAREPILLALQVLCYHIWKQRNNRMHDRECSPPEILYNIITTDPICRFASSTWLCKRIHMFMVHLQTFHPID